MAVKIQKWGNSLGVRIPKAVIEKMSLGENSEVEVEHKDGAIVIFPAKKALDLKELLAKIDKDNLHEEFDDPPQGKEIW